MSLPFFDKFLVTIRNPLIFGDVSDLASRAVWGGISKSTNGTIGPRAPIGTSTPTTPPSGPVDPNHPEDSDQPTDPGTPVQEIPPEVISLPDPPQTPDVSRQINTKYEISASDAPPGTTYEVEVPIWARGSGMDRQTKAFGKVNGQEVVVSFTEDPLTGKITGWSVDGLEVADGSPVQVELDAKIRTLSPPDPITGERTASASDDFTTVLNGTANGGSATGETSSLAGWGINDSANGSSGNGQNLDENGGGGGSGDSGSGGGTTGPGGVEPPDTPPAVKEKGGAAYESEILGYYLRFGYPRAQQVFGNSDGRIIINESYTNWPAPGQNLWVWSSVFLGYDEDGNPIYGQDWAWQPYFSVGGMITRVWKVGGPNDPSSGGTHYLPDTIDTGGPVQLQEDNPVDLSEKIKDGLVTPPEKPGYSQDDLNLVSPSVTDPITVSAQPTSPQNNVSAQSLPMEEYPMTKDIVIHTTVDIDDPYETSEGSAPDGDSVLLNYSGFSFENGDGPSFSETVRFKYLPLKARVEDQPAGNHGFYTAVVGPFTGARFRELVENIGAKVELFWDGPGQPLILFRKMPVRANPLATSTVSFRENASAELSRDVTVNWSIKLPVPFGLGYKYDSSSLPGRILLRRMMCPNEPNMETQLNLQRFDFGELPTLSWSWERISKSAPSDGNVLVWRADVTHTISFENP